MIELNFKKCPIYKYPADVIERIFSWQTSVPTIKNWKYVISAENPQVCLYGFIDGIEYLIYAVHETGYIYYNSEKNNRDEEYAYTSFGKIKLEKNI